MLGFNLQINGTANRGNMPVMAAQIMIDFGQSVQGGQIDGLLKIRRGDFNAAGYPDVVADPIQPDIATQVVRAQ